MRFTIRDLLWLMVVIGMACALVVSIRERRSIANKLSEVEGTARRQSMDLVRTKMAFSDELSRVSGKRVTGWGSVIDSSEPSGYKWTFRYAEPDKP